MLRMRAWFLMVYEKVALGLIHTRCIATMLSVISNAAPIHRQRTIPCFPWGHSAPQHCQKKKVQNAGQFLPQMLANHCITVKRTGMKSHLWHFYKVLWNKGNCDKCSSLMGTSPRKGHKFFWIEGGNVFCYICMGAWCRCVLLLGSIYHEDAK